jgi:Tfp pilus assembly protein PilX
MKNETLQETFQSQQGQIALFIVFVIMTLLLFIALFLTNTVVKQTRVARNNIDSIQAYYLADMGSERALYGIKNSSIDPTTFSAGNTIFSYNIPSLGSYIIIKESDSSPMSIKISGVFRETSRAIELFW